MSYQINLTKPSPRLARLVTKLGEFTFKVKHIKGRDNVIADYLSRKDEEDIDVEFSDGKFIITHDKCAECRRKLKIARLTETSQVIVIQERAQTTPDKGLEKYKTETPIKIYCTNKNENLGQDTNKQQVLQQCKEAQDRDPYWVAMKQHLRGERINVDRNYRERIKKNAHKFVLDNDNVLWKKAERNNSFFDKVIVLTEEKGKEQIKTYHDNWQTGGHFGYRKTLEKLKQQCHFTKMAKHIKEYVVSCDICQKHRNNAEKYGMLKPMNITDCIPMQHIEIDFIGKFTTNHEKKYVIVAIDKATKYCFAKAVRQNDAETVIKFLKEMIFNQGRISKITCDNGTHFKNNKVHAFCKEEGTEIYHSTTYSPQTQGQVEKMNSILKNYLKKYEATEKENWPEYVKRAALAYNTTPIVGLNNVTPFYLMRGYQNNGNSSIPLPTMKETRNEQIEKAIEIRKEIPRLDKKNADKYAKAYNQKRKNKSFQENDLVLKENSRRTDKFQPKYTGPYRIVKKNTKLNYTIRIPVENGEHVDECVHVRKLIGYKHRKDSILSPRIGDDDAEAKKNEGKEPVPRRRGSPRKGKDVKIEIPKEPKKKGRPRKTTPENQSEQETDKTECVLKKTVSFDNKVKDNEGRSQYLREREREIAKRSRDERVQKRNMYRSMHSI